MAYKLISCVWEITLACCFSCKYCGSSGGAAREDELTTEECLNVVEQLSAMNCQRVSLIGGEIFMRKDWPVIVKALTSKEIRVAIITNGFLFTDKILQQLKDAKIESVAVSVDGPEWVHDKYRQTGSYHRALNAINALDSAGIPVSIISTLNAENVGYLEEFYQTVQMWPIKAWQLQACSPMGNAANGGIDIRFNPSVVMKFVASHLNDSPFILGIADNIGYYQEEEGWLRGNKSGLGFFHGCRAGLTSIGIDSVGNVRGCESMYDDKFIEGNLREKKLQEIWNSPDAFSYNRKFVPDLLTGACKECQYGIYCAGGCRSYNYFVHGNLYESAICPFNQTHDTESQCQTS